MKKFLLHGFCCFVVCILLTDTNISAQNSLTDYVIYVNPKSQGFHQSYNYGVEIHSNSKICEVHINFLALLLIFFIQRLIVRSSLVVKEQHKLDIESIKINDF